MARVIWLWVVALACLGLWEPARAQEDRAIRRIVVEDRQTAEEIRRQVQQGASFSALARTQSRGAEYSQWGYSGIVRLREVQPSMRAALSKLKEGQVSEVLPLGGQYVVFKIISPRIERHFEAAERAERAGQLPQAIQEVQAALRLEQDNVQAHLKLGLLYQGAKQFDEALQAFDKARQYAPQEAQVLLLAATAMMHSAIERHNTAQAQKALETFQQVLRLDDRYTPSVEFGIGKLYWQALQQPAQAISHLEKAADATLTVPEVHRLLIQAYYDTQRYELAWQRLRRAQDLGFDFPELLAALHQVKQQSPR